MEWQIVQTIVYIVSFLITVVGFGVKLSGVIQKNTHAINSLTERLKELTETNVRDHEHFYKSINKLKEDVTVLKEKHEADIKIIKHDIESKE
ncbi:MAG: hypothetical protein ACI35S_00755 [Anaeroplasma sp.]